MPLNDSHASPSMDASHHDKLIHNIAIHGSATELPYMQFGDSTVCHAINNINSKGIWLGDDPLDSFFPLFLLQLFLMFLFTRFIYLLLKPLGQPSFISQILILNEECFAIMVLTLVLITGIVSIIVRALYDPSRRFLAYKRRTILHQHNNEELHILACIHNPENVLAVLNLLAASNPTKASRIDLVVLHLVNLVGRASSLLVAHVPRENPSRNPTQSEKIFDTFNKFEDVCKGKLMLHCYKGISPCATMHNDVCYLALEKRTTFIIIPFHKQWITRGTTLSSSFAFKHLNKNVLAKAPCSVGVLVDRGNRKKFWCGYSKDLIYQVATLFFGGADDRETLAYARRMSEQPNVHITLFHFSSSAEIVGGTERSKVLDTQVLSEFRLNAFRNKRVSFEDKSISNGRDVISVIEHMEGFYDLVMVGRKHADSNLMSELGKWKHGELGVVGEILASCNIGAKTSILVVQQQTRFWGSHDPEESTKLRRVNV